MKHNTILILYSVVLIFSIYFFKNELFLKWLIIALTLILITFIVLGSSFIQLNYFVNNINKGNKKGIALTFDDGPDPDITPQILNLLNQENIKATFFVIGNQIDNYSEIIKKIDADGHTLGNHSFSHNKKLTYLPTSKLKADIAKCSNIIKQNINKKPLFFRPPYGITTPRYKRALQQLQLKSIGWNIRSFDTQANDPNKLYNNIINQIKDGSILLFHDTQQITLEVLPNIINYCKNNGINIVALPDLINQKAYE